MRVLVAGRLPQASLDEIQLLGVQLAYQPALSAAELPLALQGVNVLVVRGLEVDANAVAAGDALNLIVRAGSGTGNIDVAAASARGIYVANTPGRNASAVAELTMTLIGCLDRRVAAASTGLRSGAWEKDEFAQATGLRGRVMGIAGLGHVGRYVAMLARAFGLQVHAWSRSLTMPRAQELGVVPSPSLLALAQQSQVFSIHLQGSDRTKNIVGRDIIEALPDDAILVNTACPDVLDYDALLDLAPKKRLRVGLDVLPDEPLARSGRYEHPILSLPLVVATPHVGASTDEAQRAIANETVHVLRSFLTRGEVPNVVNISGTSSARYQLVVRHVEKTGALAHVLGVLKRNGVHVKELDNTVFEGGKAACAKIRVETRPSDSCLAEIMAFSSEILHVDLVALPNLA